MNLTAKTILLLASTTHKHPRRDAIRVGVVQTIIRGNAWKQHGWRMNRKASESTWQAIERAFQQFHVLVKPPDVVVLPEVSIPRWRLRSLRRMCAGLPCLAIVGLDFDVSIPGEVANQAALMIPTRWPEEKPSRNCRLIHIGKTYPSEEERKMIKKNRPRRRFRSDPTLWLFDADHLGRFGICLCYDFMDVDRLPLYRGEIQHLFVLAYNRDVTTFAHIAESLCRTLYCNVVVCNTGFFGSSAAMTPYARHYRRPVYRIQGQQLETSQIISLPVKAILEAQAGGSLGEDGTYEELKALPPGLPRKGG